MRSPIDGNLEVSLSAANHEPLVADANHLAVQLSVVTHGQHGDRRAHRGSKKGRRGSFVGRRRSCCIYCSGRALRLALALEAGDRLTNLLVGLDQSAGTFHMRVRLPGSGWLRHEKHTCYRVGQECPDEMGSTTELGREHSSGTGQEELSVPREG